MNKLFIVVSLAALGLLAAACIGTAPAPAPGSALPQVAGGAYLVPPSQQTGLWVNGEGRVSYVPDIAVLSLGIEAQEKTVAQAQERARQAMSRILAALKAKNVADKDIRTQHFSIQPVREPLRVPPPLGSREPEFAPTRYVIVGYRVSNQVTVKIRNIDGAGPIIDAVAEAGGDLTRINSISFTMDEFDTLRRQGREKAVKDALAKAQQMAGLAGVELGKPIYITESGGYIPRPMEMRVFAEGVPAPMAPPPTPISPGESELTVSVQMVFALK